MLLQISNSHLYSIHFLLNQTFHCFLSSALNDFCVTYLTLQYLKCFTELLNIFFKFNFFISAAIYLIYVTFSRGKAKVNVLSVA